MRTCTQPLTLPTPCLQLTVASDPVDPDADAVRLGVGSEGEGSGRLLQTRYHAQHTLFHDLHQEASAARDGAR
jgi:hypothetical protein